MQEKYLIKKIKNLKIQEKESETVEVSPLSSAIIYINRVV